MPKLLLALAFLAGAYVYLGNGGRIGHLSGGGGSLMSQFGAPATGVGGAAIGAAAKIGN